MAEKKAKDFSGKFDPAGGMALTFRKIQNKYSGDFLNFLLELEKGTDPSIPFGQHIVETVSRVKQVVSLIGAILGGKGRPVTDEEVSELFSAMSDVEDRIREIPSFLVEDEGLKEKVSLIEEKSKVSLEHLGEAQKHVDRYMRQMGRTRESVMKKVQAFSPEVYEVGREMAIRAAEGMLGPFAPIGKLAIQAIGGLYGAARRTIRAREARNLDIVLARKGLWEGKGFYAGEERREGFKGVSPILSEVETFPIVEEEKGSPPEREVSSHTVPFVEERGKPPSTTITPTVSPAVIPLGGTSPVVAPPVVSPASQVSPLKVGFPAKPGGVLPALVKFFNKEAFDARWTRDVYSFLREKKSVSGVSSGMSREGGQPSLFSRALEYLGISTLFRRGAGGFRRTAPRVGRFLLRRAPIIVLGAGIVDKIFDVWSGAKERRAESWFDKKEGERVTLGEKVSTGAGTVLGGGGQGVGNVVANVLSYGGIGAGVGSFIPGIGTAIGAGIGAGVGLIGGLVGGERIAKGLHAVGSGVVGGIGKVGRGVSLASKVLGEFDFSSTVKASFFKGIETFKEFLLGSSKEFYSLKDSVVGFSKELLSFKGSVSDTVREAQIFKDSIRDVSKESQLFKDSIKDITKESQTLGGLFFRDSQKFKEHRVTEDLLHESFMEPQLFKESQLFKEASNSVSKEFSNFKESVRDVSKGVFSELRQKSSLLSRSFIDLGRGGEFDSLDLPTPIFPLRSRGVLRTESAQSVVGGQRGGSSLGGSEDKHAPVGVFMEDFLKEIRGVGFGINALVERFDKRSTVVSTKSAQEGSFFNNKDPLLDGLNLGILTMR